MEYLFLEKKKLFFYNLTLFFYNNERGGHEKDVVLGSICIRVGNAGGGGGLGVGKY